MILRAVAWGGKLGNGQGGLQVVELYRVGGILAGVGGVGEETSHLLRRAQRGREGAKFLLSGE